MIVRIPSLLFSYTGNQARVEASGGTVGAALADLERQFPGLRFRLVDEQDRIRPHIKVFVDGKLAKGLSTRVRQDGELMIVGALSGG